MSHYQTLEIVDAIYEYFRRCQRWRLRRVRVYSPLGDGSTDVSTTEQKRNRLDDELLNKLMFICLHAPKSILALKVIVNDIRMIWKENKDRYKAKWSTWEAVANQMDCDELDINKDWQ